METDTDDSLEKWERQIGLVSALLKRSEPLSRFQIEATVTGYGEPLGAEAARKRLKRDIEELQTAGVRIVFTRNPVDGSEGYALDQSRSFLPQIEITPDENFLMNLLARSAEPSDRSAVTQNLRTALLKLQCSSGLAGSADADREEKILIRNRLADGPEAPNLSRALQAVADRQTVQFRYRSAGEEEARPRELDPYGLGFHAAAWYLVGYCHTRQEVRVFKLSRVVGRMTAGPAAEGFAVPDTFRIEDYVGVASWTIGSDPVPAQVRFDAEIGWMIAQNVRSGDRCEPLGDGGVMLHLTVSDPLALVRWVLKFKQHARIEGPETLVALIKSEIAESLARYAEGPER